LKPVHNDNDVYSEHSVKALFDEMSKTYGIVNLIASMGFTAIWRKRCLRSARPVPNANIVDLMTGMGEMFASLSSCFKSVKQVIAIDFSKEMCSHARQNSLRWKQLNVVILELDALSSGLPSASADYVCCSFGLKTLSREQQSRLAFEVSRILKLNGKCSFIEISVPQSKMLRIPFLFYLRKIIPFVGRAFLGNPANYKMLSKYTESFGNARHFERCLKNEGLDTDYFEHFFGCATGVEATKR
jgi:ubiquinone/menaquinone biosynthesis methyltransferase